MPVLREVLSTPEDDGIVIRGIGTSEDEKQKTQDRSFRKKAMNASRKLRHTLRRRGKRAPDRQRAAIIIHDVRYIDEEKAVHSLPSKELAFHEYLSASMCGITRPEVAATKSEHFSSRSDFDETCAPRKSLKNLIFYVTSSLLHWILRILAFMQLLFGWLGRSIMVIYADMKSKKQYLPPSTESESQVNCTYAELEDLLWKKLLYLESLVMELYNAENHPEEEDMFLESINRIICIEYDLQKTEKMNYMTEMQALRNTASKQVELNESMEYFMESSLTEKQERKLLQQTGVLVD